MGRSRYRRGLSGRIPLWRSLGTIALAVVVVKALILAQIGPISYHQRLESAAGDSVVQQVSIYIMQIDPVTEWMAGEMVKLVGLLG